MSLYLLLDVFIAYVIDIFIGDPRWMPHPVKFIGWLTKKLEKAIRKFVKSLSNKKIKALGEDIVRNYANTNRREKIAGIYFAVIIIAIVSLLVLGLVIAASFAHPVLFHIVNIYFIYTAFSTRCLAVESLKVYDALKERDIFKARNMLSMIVGRQTENLDENEVIKGAVETTAENTSDGVIAPVCYAVLGSIFGLGAPLVYIFKTISTLDSIVGYKNDEYRYFGWASAKLDDLANYIPARLTGILLVVSAFITRKDYKESYSIMMRDRRKHHSPNSGYPEAAVAGALGIRLGGSGMYFGEVVEKPVIGDNTRKVEFRDISDTINMMYVTSILGLIGLGSVFLLVYAVGLLI